MKKLLKGGILQTKARVNGSSLSQLANNGELRAQCCVAFHLFPCPGSLLSTRFYLFWSLFASPRLCASSQITLISKLRVIGRHSTMKLSAPVETKTKKKGKGMEREGAEKQEPKGSEMTKKTVRDG